MRMIVIGEAVLLIPNAERMGAGSLVRIPVRPICLRTFMLIKKKVIRKVTPDYPGRLLSVEAGGFTPAFL
ncbi:MAG: hypothetical protein C0403_01035 [Desulfobacterium sp.]|nr:hypothetical protein [Desulfobacterium sp.]